MSVSRPPVDNTPETVMVESGSAKIPARALFVVGNEACERLSYYGMTSILTLYVADVLKKGDTAATVTTAMFTGAVYFMPLFGGILADRWLGRYRTILFLSIFYCFGHLALALFEGDEAGLYLGLGLIAFGAGGIKPCVSAYMGDQFDADDKRAITKAYSLFYWAINFGSFFGLAIIPWVKKEHGYAWAFGIPGILMGLASIVFVAGTKTYRNVPPAGRRPGFLAVIRHCLTSPEKSTSFWERARGVFDDELVDGSRRTAGVIGLFSVLPVFWALYHQTNTTWILQGNRLAAVTLNLPFIGAWDLDKETIQTLNPALVMIMIPGVTFGLYPLAEKLGLRPTPLRRMTTGMVLAAGAFVLCALIQRRVDTGEHLPILWQTGPYVLLTLGEVLFSTTGLEFAFTQAPKMMKSTIMSFWLLTTAVGNLAIAGFAASLNDVFAPFTMFLLYAGLMLLVAGVFGLLAKRYAAKHTA